MKILSFDKDCAELWFIQHHAVKDSCAGCYTAACCITDYVQHYTSGLPEKHIAQSLRVHELIEAQKCSKGISQKREFHDISVVHKIPYPLGKFHNKVFPSND